jgi:hypothetical protein
MRSLLPVATSRTVEATTVGVTTDTPPLPHRHPLSATSSSRRCTQLVATGATTTTAVAQYEDAENRQDTTVRIHLMMLPLMHVIIVGVNFTIE